jgi:hypothetical protein
MLLEVTVSWAFRLVAPATAKIIRFVIANTATVNHDAMVRPITVVRGHRHLKEIPMRFMLLVACAAALAISAWSNIPTADAKQHADTLISPLAMMVTTTNLSTERFDAF